MVAGPASTRRRSTLDRLRADLLAAAAVVVLSALPDPARAQALPSLASDEPILLQADEVEYARELELVVARGNVEVAQGDRIVRADSLTYNRRDGIVTAQGNVAMVEPDGSVMFASYAQLDEGFAKGIARDLKARLADQTLLVAAGSTREGRFTQMDKAAYTACELCEDNPDRPALWQIKADKVTHDEQTRAGERRPALTLAVLDQRAPRHRRDDRVAVVREESVVMSQACRPASDLPCGLSLAGLGRRGGQ